MSMKCRERDGWVEVAGLTDFDPPKTFECGQCFRWNCQPDGSWLGVAGGRAARVRKDGGIVRISGTLEEFQTYWREYLDLGRDYGALRGRISGGDYLAAAAEYGAGLHILRQDGWETLCSFLISQCNNITRIKRIVESLCARFGKPFLFEGEVRYAFPGPERLAACTEGELAPLRCGYRAPYLLAAARAVAGGGLDLDRLAEGETGRAREELLKLPGVGNKVADCVLLFGLGKTDAFPVDVWVRRAMNCAGEELNVSALGEYAGLAQQYLFYYARGIARSGGAE